MAEPDWNRWQKVAAVANPFASVVLAVGGLLVTYNIQRYQIEVERAKNAADTRLQEARIASDMLKELVTSDAKHRPAILVMIEPYLAKEKYTQLCAALAREDEEPKVRHVALQQLGNVPDRKSLEVLRGIASDPSAPAQDRGLAQKSAESVESALERAASLRTLTNPQSPLRVKLTVVGCCIEGQEMRIQLQNLSLVPLYAAVLDIDSTGRIGVLASSYLLQPNEKAITVAVAIASAALGVEVIRVIGSKTPIDPSNFDAPALRKLDPTSWCTEKWVNIQTHD